MKKILLIDDDRVTHQLVKSALASDFEIVSCYSIQEANAFLDTAVDISAAIIDRSLPDGDGLSVCSRIRQDARLSSLPVLFLSGALQETDKVSAFFAGADDYITKPFGPLELKARMQARLKQQTSKIAIAGLTVDVRTQRAYLFENGHLSEIDLTRTEFKILLTLIQSLDQVFSRNALLDKVWGIDCHVSDRVVDSHVSHLRKKIAKAGLKLDSLRGEGYRLTVKNQLKNHAA